ncbi:uncharacterized protein Pyn_08516 [Prunus yedoensis var. nudiflora]|uniref:Uncharacterized protein n=1 Tax=Prunus yedoensis var. nudiflora TaxID=2094558 RepID=A0A314Z020_PRUYE|nr:uncharacterized protein Pyn_08516 [Prunus yedoensis var. nudiflora]
MQKMINAFKTFRIQSPALIFSSPLPPPPPGLGRKASGVRFKQTTTLRSSESDSEHNMDKPEPNPTEKTGNSLSHPFGEGYATRCDDDGFGVVYGGIRSDPKMEQDENHPAVDKSQGSEVREKEKARHQKSASS